MNRSVHLCSSRVHADLAMAACASAMAPGDACIIVDDRLGVDRARRLGLRFDAHLAPPMRMASLASRALRVMLDEELARDRTLVCWGAHLEPLAAATRADQLVVDFSRGIVERFPGSLRGPGPIRTMPIPGAPLLSPLAPTRHAEWRQRLELDPADRAIALVGVNQHDCDVPAFVHVLGMLHFARIPVVGIVDRALMSRHRAAIRRAREAMPNLRVLVRDEPVLSWVGACDVALLAPGDRFDRAQREDRFDVALLTRSIAATGVPVISADVPSDLADPCVVSVESAHPAVMARALRACLERPRVAPASVNNDASTQWRRALAAVQDPMSQPSLAEASA